MLNHLMMYEGGGYDGCFWEWNACFWDKKGKWHNIYSSGRMGCSTEEEALRFMENEETADEWELIDMYSEKAIDKWQKTYNEGFVIGVCKVVNRICECQNFEGDSDIESPLFITCDVCDCKITEPSEMQAVDWVSAGGIMMQATGKVCNECYLSGCCPDCGEWCGSADEADKCCSDYDEEDKQTDSEMWNKMQRNNE